LKAANPVVLVFASSPNKRVSARQLFEARDGRKRNLSAEAIGKFAKGLAPRYHGRILPLHGRVQPVQSGEPKFMKQDLLYLH
jgi:hypothetical protein